MRHSRGFSPYSHRNERKAAAMLFLSLALLSAFGLVAVGVVILVRDSNKSAPSPVVRIQKDPEIAMFRTFVATQDIEPGSEIRRHHLREKLLPKALLQGMTPPLREDLLGRYAADEIQKGALLYPSLLLDKAPKNIVIAKIPTGYRGVTIRVSEVSSIAGWIEPGTFVDVSWLGTINGEPGAHVIVEYAKILSVEQRATATRTGAEPSGIPSTVTLLVTASDAQLIQLAQNSGQLSLSLRGQDDPGKASALQPITTRTLFHKGFNEEKQAERFSGFVRFGGKSWQVDRRGNLHGVRKGLWK